MENKLIKAEYVITDNYSGVEISVRLEIDYVAKSFSVKSARKDSMFNFIYGNNPDRVISIGNAIRLAAEFAKMELDEKQIIYTPDSSDFNLEKHIDKCINSLLIRRIIMQNEADEFRQRSHNMLKKEPKNTVDFA